MKTILSSRRDHYLAKFSIFLIAVALIAGMVGCTTPTGYNLTISSTAGGSVIATVNEEEIVISPGEEEIIRDIPEDTEVDLVATPGADCRFVSWIGNVKTIVNVKAAKTKIIMKGSTIHYSITAEFVEGQEIRSWKDLDAIRDDLSGDHILMNELNSNSANYTELASPTANGGKGWEPIKTFASTFDGQEYEIRDLFIDRPEEFGVGLFGYVDVGGKIMNLGVVNASVTGNGSVGGLVGWNQGIVRDSYSSGSVIGSDEHVGGLVGWNERTEENKGTVENSYSTSNVKGNDKYVGGLVGYNKGGSVTNSHSSGYVTGNDEYVGGLVGYNEGGSVTDSHSSGNVTGNDKYVGGLVGYNECGTVTNSHSSGNVTGSDEHVGGLVGWNEGTRKNEGTVEDSYSTGNVKGYDKVGGLVGFNNHNSRVSKSHSTGSVGSVISEEGSDIGGLVGWNEGKVEDSYSTGEVTGKTNVGGLVGENVYTVERSYSTGKVTGKTNVGSLVGENRGTVSSSNSTGSVDGTDDVGGLVGHNEGTVERSISMGSVTGEYCVGGLVGENDDTVKESYSTSSVTGSTYSRRVGGLVGYNYGGEDSVSDSYSTGSVAGNRYVGGLVGYNEQSKVSNSYSTGTVNGTDDAGGLVGVNNGDEEDVRNCFWNTETSLQANSDGGTGKTKTDMKQIETYTEKEAGVLDEEWDIFPVLPGQTNPAYTWNINIDKQSYPFLGWQSV